MTNYSRVCGFALSGLMSVAAWAETEVLPPAAPPIARPASLIPLPQASSATQAVPALAPAAVQTLAPASVPIPVPVPQPVPMVRQIQAEPLSMEPGQMDHGSMMPSDSMPVSTTATATGHVARAGSWMIDYRYTHTALSGLLHGASKVSPNDVYTSSALKHAGKSDTMANKSMSMDMHMFMLKYAMSDRFSWMVATTPYVMNMMDMDMTMGGSDMSMPMMKSKGLGDTDVGFDYELERANADDTWTVSAGLSLPTGSVDVKGSDGVRLPYSMQLGSGTFDVKVALGYEHLWGPWGAGARATDTTRLGHNKNGWNAGDRQELSTWGKYRLEWGTTVQTKLAFSYQEMISGSDSGLGDTSTYAGVRPENYGGLWLDLVGTVSHPFGPVTVSADFGVPMHQNLNGVQLRTSWLFGFGLSYMM